MRMTSFSMAISCTSTCLLRLLLAPSNWALSVDLSTMKAPVACWPGTVARTQGSVTVTSACARVGRLNKAARENRELAIVRFILIILLGFTCSKPAPGGYQPRLRQPFAYGAGQFA